MIEDLQLAVESIPLTSEQFVGIPFALVGAVFLSLGAQFQSRGVGKVERNTGTSGGSGLSVQQLLFLLARPSWVFGTAMLGLAIVFQLVSLGFSPLIVVQPLGAVALVITAIMNSRISKIKLNHRSVVAIIMCVGGVGLFVTIAAFTARAQPVTEAHLITILLILLCVVVVFGVAFFFLRRHFKAIFYIIGAGVLYGFVATLAKVVISRISQGDFEWLTMTCLVALLAATGMGAYFVQSAYSSGPPDLVIAGLTVIDPLVAVIIGIVVLGEASQAPVWALFAFAITGAIATWGVLRLAKYHPQAQ